MRRILLLCTILILGCISYRAIAWTDGDISNCNIFPADNYWNRDISADPVHPQSAAIIAHINGSNTGSKLNVHPDFGGSETNYYGIPWITVTNSQTPIIVADSQTPVGTDSITFDYDDESDHVPYPIPYNAPFEGGPGADGDNHVLVINTDTCILYETYASHPEADNSAVHNKWTAGSGAVFDLNSNALRPEGWTSADAAGLPIFPGLARCDEANTGAINHALRFTVADPRNIHVFPATHTASDNPNPLSPPYGARFRLKASFSEAGFHGQALAVVRALKRYGMIMADGGSNWYISGDYPIDSNGWKDCWTDQAIDEMKTIPSAAFEVLAYPGTSAPTAPHFSTKTPTLTWSRITWATSYEVQVSTVSTFGTFTTYTVDAPNTNVTLSPALAEGTYYWRVRAKDATTTSTWTPGSFVIAIIP